MPLNSTFPLLMRPLFNTADSDLPTLLTHMADKVYEAVFRYEGTITAISYIQRVKEVLPR